MEAMTLDGGSESPKDTKLATLREAYLERLTRPGQPFQIADAFPMPAELPALYDQLTELKACLDSFRPLDPAQAENLREVFDTEYTFHSNAIEGNTLSLMETDFVINKGMTVGGHPLREHLEATNHQVAIDFVRDLVSANQDLTPFNLNQIHGLILHGIDRDNAGRYRSGNVSITGSRHTPPEHFHVVPLMHDLFVFYEAHKSTLHPVQLAAEMHEKLATIHPYSDGNGRTARLLMNLILLRAGYPISIISSDQHERGAYYRTLEAANLSPTGDNSEFQRFVALNVRGWLLRYLGFVASNVSSEAKPKGLRFFQAIAPFLNGNARP